MANTQTFSIKLTANGKEVKALQEELIKLANKYEQELEGINKQLKERKDLTEKERKELEKQSDSLAAKIKGLNTAVEENVTKLRTVGDVMKNLAGSSGGELGKALRGLGQQFKSVSEQTLKHGETMEQKLAEIKEKMMEVRHEMTKREGIDAMKRAKATLTELSNTPLDKLKMGLESIEKRLSAMSDAEKQAADGLALLEGRSQYKAQIAVNEYGRAGTLSLQSMSDDQLHSEQSRLRGLYSATEGVKGYEGISQDALNRLQKANQLIKERADAEREAARAAKEADEEAQRRIEFAQQGQRTHQTLANMEKASYEDLEAALKHLQEQYKTYASGDVKHIQRNLAAQDQLKQRMKDMQSLLLTEQELSDRVNNKKKYSIIQLQQAYDQLKSILASIPISEKRAIESVQRDMKSLQKEISKAKGELTGFAKLWNTALKNIGAYMGVFAVAGFLKNKIQGMVRDNLSLSDSMVQVQKVTGLMSDEIKQLNFNLAKFDTRTTLTQLNELAYSAGKMGLGKYRLEGVEGFVRAANQLQVALGEDLGASVDEAITPLAKLAENLGLIQKMGVEKSMMAIGSSINELSQTTTAVGKNIVEFARRIQPSAQMIGLTTDEILALGSATDSFGVSAEVSATAFTKFLAAYRTNTAEIEKILNMVPGTLDKFFDEGRAIEGLMAIFQRMHEMGDLRYLEDAFKALGSEGSKMFLTFGAFSKNIDTFREHLITSNEAFAEAVSITEEFNLVQATAEGIMERANNMWQNAFVNPEGVDTIKQLAEGWYNLTKQLTESTNWLTGVKTSLEMIAWVVSNLLKILPQLTKALFFFGVAKAIRYVTIEVNIMNAAMTAATTTVGKLNAVLRSNVWVLAITALSLIGAKLYDMAKASKEAADKLDVLKEAEENAETESRKQRVELKKLYDATKDQTKSIEERKEALRKMVGDDKYNQYYKQLSNEKDLATAAASAYRDLTEEIFRSAQARAYANKIEELENKRMEMEDEKAKKEQWRDENKGKYEAGKREYKNQQDYTEEATRGVAGFPEAGIARRGAAAMKPKIIEEYEGTEKAIANIDNDIKGVDADMEKLKDKIRSLNATPEPAGGGGGGGGGTTDTTTEKEAKAPKWMKDEKENAEKATKAVIASIEEFYRLQEAAANELAANGQLEGKDFEMLIKHIQDRKDQMLLEARRAIVGDKNSWDKIKMELEGDLVKRDSEVSREAIKRIQEAEPAKQGAALQKYNGSAEVYKLDSNAYLNSIRKNAAQNELNIQRRQAAIQQEVDKILLQYEYVEQAQRKFGDKLVTLGLITDGYDKVVKQLADGTEIVANTRDVQALANKTVKMDSLQFYGVDEDDALELRNMIDALMHTVDEDGKKIRESFASMFPNLDEWMKYPEQYLEQMQAFYKTLIDMDADYYKALKQNYEQEKREFGERWQAMGWEAQERQENTAFETQDSLRKISGQGENFGQTYGFADEIADDPEIARIKNRMEWRARELEDLQARNASEELIMEKQNEMLKEAAALAEKVSAEVAERVGKIQTLSEPLESWGEEVGTMLGEMWQGISRDGKLTFGQMAKNMGIEYAKLTLKMASENLMKKLQQNLFYKQMELAEMKHQAEMTTIETGGELGRMAAQTSIGATALGVKAGQDAAEVSAEGGKASIMTMFGISEGAAKTIGTLGFWGIPLIGVITALLMGLLNSAKSTAGTESAKASNTPKVKLARGMLTYNKGNVQRFIGQDGKVYTATEEPQPKDGLVTHPIATTVQGQPALVAENGPEIVVGRETTRAIMMNEPELIKYLANYEKYGGKTGYATARGMATFDSGNVEQVAATVPDASQPNDNAEIRKTMNEMRTVMSQVLYYLQHPVRPKIDMFSHGGEDGLYDSMKKADKFMSKYQ